MLGRRGFLKTIGAAVLGMSLALKAPEVASQTFGSWVPDPNIGRHTVFPIAQVFTRWSSQIITNRHAEQLILRDDAYRQFLERMHEYDYPNSDSFELIGIWTMREQEMPAHPEGWAYGRAWYLSPRTDNA